MPKQLPSEEMKQKQQLVAELEEEFTLWRSHFQDLAKFILPRRYSWLQANPMKSTTSSAAIGASSSGARNEYILDPTATKAARTLAAGMFNGITSPARPWFRLRLAGFSPEQNSVAVKRWLDEATSRIQSVMAESNFYNAMAIKFLDLGVFGTSAMVIYEDFDQVIRCYNAACGEYRIAQDERGLVSVFSRIIVRTVRQTVKEFGEENVSPETLREWKKGGASLQNPVVIVHLIEPNDGALSSKFSFRELYWEKGNKDGKVLREAGYRERPQIVSRWELIGNDSYGSSPAQDALPDIMQLQQETKAKAKSLDYMNNPPMVVDSALQGKRTALMPRGVTFVPNSSQVGAKPAYQITPPVNEMSQDIRSIQLRIAEMFHNDLFRMISQLDTVRSATEIDARREEKLVLLGSVLERFENEALDPAIQRIYNIMERKKLLPEKPPELEDAEIDVEYVSILSDAQRAASTGSIERFMQVIGETAAAVPELINLPDWQELIRDYADRLNVPAAGIKPRQQLQAEQQAAAQRQQAEQAIQQTKELTDASKNLSETNLGGGRTALQALLG